jgi:hypothetical protein
MEDIMKLTWIAFFLLFVTSTVQADSSVDKLSPELRALLSKEMLALEEGMKSIMPAYISGDLEKVSRIAKKMKNSFILNQKITGDQKHELMNKMPKAFLQLDKEFHEYSGMLEHVAKEKHIELVGFYYYKLNESCVACHRQFAGHRFPKFQPESIDNGHHH